MYVVIIVASYSILLREDECSMWNYNDVMLMLYCSVMRICKKWSIMKVILNACLHHAPRRYNRFKYVSLHSNVHSYTMKVLVSYFKKLITDQMIRVCYWYSNVIVKQKYSIVIKVTSLCKPFSVYIFQGNLISETASEKTLQLVVFSICSNLNH